MMIFCHSFDNPEITALEGKEELEMNGMECVAWAWHLLVFICESCSHRKPV